eukprot:scaffold3586_cov404-Prasinococcus_capsulatus_cf.AAC.29
MRSPCLTGLGVRPARFGRAQTQAVNVAPVEVDCQRPQAEAGGTHGAWRDCLCGIGTRARRAQAPYRRPRFDGLTGTGWLARILHTAEPAEQASASAPRPRGLRRWAPSSAIFLVRCGCFGRATPVGVIAGNL